MFGTKEYGGKGEESRDEDDYNILKFITFQSSSFLLSFCLPYPPLSKYKVRITSKLCYRPSWLHKQQPPQTDLAHQATFVATKPINSLTQKSCQTNHNHALICTYRLTPPIITLSLRLDITKPCLVAPTKS
jgi:hypothetical protein